MKPATLTFYALPAMPLAALTLPLYIIVPTFYSESLGLSLAATGSALLAVRLFDAVNDPVIGWLADRWRPRFGRRRAVFAAGIPFAALGALMLFWPPQGAGAAYLVTWGLALSLGSTAMLISYSSWGAELAGNYAERTRIAGAREAMTLVGTLVAIALPFAIGMSVPAGMHGLAILGVLVAAALVFFGPLVVWKVPEPAEYSTNHISLTAGLGHMARNRPFLRLISAFFLNGLANGIPATLFLYFVSARLGVPEMRGPLLFVYFLAGIAGVPLAVALAGRLGKHRAWSVAMIAACGIFSMVPLLDSGQLIEFSVICAATGLLLGFDLALPPAIQADVIDIDTARSGEQRTGLYFAVWGLATKLSLALGVGITFSLLAWFGFDPAATSNKAESLSALAALYAWLPVAFKIAAIGLMWNFPLGETEQAGLRTQIERGIEP